MAKSISKSVGTHGLEPVSLSELIHQHVRVAIETAVHEELRAALAAAPYERGSAGSLPCHRTEPRGVMAAPRSRAAPPESRVRVARRPPAASPAASRLP